MLLSLYEAVFTSETVLSGPDFGFSDYPLGHAPDFLSSIGDYACKADVCHPHR
jgi:hypothetical protein